MSTKFIPLDLGVGVGVGVGLRCEDALRAQGVRCEDSSLGVTKRGVIVLYGRERACVYVCVFGLRELLRRVNTCVPPL